MEAIGSLTGGIAHDFNNLLGVVVLSMEEMIRAAVENDGEMPRPKIPAPADDVRGGVDRATKLTRQLLAFARRRRCSPRW